jgi:hypothetical protein
VRFIKDHLELRDAAGEPVTAHGYTVTPWSQAVVVRLPHARFVWNRPIGVDVTHDGQTVRVPIVASNRLWPVVLLGILAAVVAVSRLLGSRPPERKETAS